MGKVWKTFSSMLVCPKCYLKLIDELFTKKKAEGSNKIEPFQGSKLLARLEN